MLLALAGITYAATVAVLDFDGYGVAWSDAQTATQGLRDAFLEEGLLDPLSGSDIADGAGPDAGLRRARERVAEGRRRCDAGDAEGSIAALREALDLHAAARSDVGRRPEVADAWFLYGTCLQRFDRDADARAAFTEVAWLHPRYARERAGKLPTATADALRAAEDGLSRAPRRLRASREVAAIASSLNVDYVVTGSVEADGRVRTRLYEGDRLLGEATATLAQVPAQPVDEAYAALARELAGATGAGGPVAGQEDDELFAALDPEEAAELEAELRGDTPRPTATATPAPAPRSTYEAPRRAPSARDPDRGAIPTSRNRTPVAETWWFWTGAFLLVAGGGGAVGWVLWEPEPEIVEQPDAWTVRIATD